MTKKAFLLLAIIVSMSSMAYAEESTATVNVGVTASTPAVTAEKGAIKLRLQEREANRLEKVQKVEERREEVRLRLEEQKTEVKTKFTKKRGDMMDKRLENLARQYEQAVSRIKDMQTRLDARIAKIGATGKDVTVAKDLLAKSRAELAIAETAGAQLKADLSAATTIEAKIALLKTGKDTLKEIGAHLKESKHFLTESISSLKGMSGKVKIEAQAGNSTSASQQ